MFDCLNIINIVGNMTIEEKAKAYDEALERAKAYHRNELAGSRKEMMEYIFPQLCESDDEKIRKALIDGVSQIRCKGDVTREQMIAYLEKQKEQPISAEEVLARAGLKPYKDGNKWCILAGDNIQEGICGFGDTIDEALYQFLLEVLEMQKEQKPTAIINGEPIPTENHSVDIPLAEWSEEDEIHVRSIFGDFRQDVVPDEEDQYWLKKKLESLRLRPMDEWSEEDIANRNFILESLEDQIRFCKKDAEGAYYAKQIRTAQNWLKSLHPNKQD